MEANPDKFQVMFCQNLNMVALMTLPLLLVTKL